MVFHKLNLDVIKDKVVHKTNQVIDSLNEPLDPETATIIHIKKSDMRTALQLMLDQAVLLKDDNLIDSVVDVRNNLNKMFPYSDVITNEEREKL